MRAVAAILIATAAVTAPAQTAKKPAAAATRRPVPRTPRLPLPADPKASEGMAAVGTMPASTGPAAELFAMRFVDIKIGEGELARPSTPPSAIVFYTVHYTGWTTDGKKFDSSVDRGQPIVFPIGLKRVIAGWDTGFEGMRVGGKRRLIIPWQLAYGAAGHPPEIPERADLVFDIELVGQGNTQQPVTGSVFAQAPTVPNPASGSNTTTPRETPATAKPAERPEERHE